MLQFFLIIYIYFRWIYLGICYICVETTNLFLCERNNLWAKVLAGSQHFEYAVGKCDSICLRIKTMPSMLAGSQYPTQQWVMSNEWWAMRNEQWEMSDEQWAMSSEQRFLLESSTFRNCWEMRQHLPTDGKLMSVAGFELRFSTKHDNWKSMWVAGCELRFSTKHDNWKSMWVAGCELRLSCQIERVCPCHMLSLVLASSQLFLLISAIRRLRPRLLRV